ncbi:MAG: ABC transporter ATP-binding protein [Parachlamydiaceae bacterium]|nr:ABC transporter ATP-binding protein [Parachlamydiaceae bacterium]
MFSKFFDKSAQKGSISSSKANNAKSLLNVSNLTVHFSTRSGPVKAVTAIDFHINSGEILGIVGESGSGKSVTAQSILKLLPKNGHIISGDITFDNQQILTKTEREMENIRGKQIGMIFQDPMTALNPTLRIGYQIAEGLIKHEKFNKKKAKEKVLELLEQVGITDPQLRIGQYPHELSGGMRQRIMIAIALACKPRLLIADEPTTALDVTIQAQILELLKQIQCERQFSILLITHDLGVVANICDRVLVMYKGKIVEDAPVDQLFCNPQHPYTKTLLTAKSLKLKGLS